MTIARSVISGLLAAACLLAAVQPARAADRVAYTTAVAQARSLVQEARNGRPEAARQAADVLRKGTGDTLQPVLEDLDHNPPLLDDAQARLDATATALARPGVDANPAADQRKLESILAQPRYAGLRQKPPNLLQQALDWLARQFFNWLSGLRLGGLGLPFVPLWIWVTLLVVFAVSSGLALLAVFRPGRLGTGVVARVETGGVEVRARSRDFFETADALAAEGQYDAALRALVAGVATRMRGRVFWTSSPLTVRELFREKDELESLRPLLVAFERSVYGHRPPDQAEYRAADQLAVRFRMLEEEAA